MNRDQEQEMDEGWEGVVSKPNRRRVQEEVVHRVVSDGNWVPREVRRENRKDRDRQRNQKLREAGK